MSAELKFRMLGPLEVERGGHAVALAGKQQLALLALLLFHANQPLSADRLVEELWGEPTPPRALKRLQLAITRLRQALGRPELDTLTNGYLLRVEPSGLDAEVFQGVLKTTIRNPGEDPGAKLRTGTQAPLCGGVSGRRPESSPILRAPRTAEGQTN